MRRVVGLLVLSAAVVAGFLLANASLAQAGDTPTTLTVDPATGTYGDTVDLTATLTPAVADMLIKFYINDVLQGTDNTNVSGLATLTGVALTMNAGTHTIRADFDGDATYAPSSGSNSLNINPATLTVTGITAYSRTYDGTTNATLNVAVAALVGVIGVDDVTLDTSSAAGTFVTKNAGTGIVVLVSGLTLNGADAGNYTLVQPTTSADINQAPLTITALTNTKTYDGNTTAAAIPTASGLKGSDTVSGLTEAYDNRNAGTGKTLSVATYTVNDGNGGNNYSVSLVNDTTGVINQRNLTITALTNIKTYDGNTTAAAIPSVSGLQGSDTVTGLTETYDNRNAGTGKTLSVATYTVNDGNNYSVSLVNDTTGVINQRNLTVTATGVNRVYDATTATTVTLADDRVAGDVMTTSYASASFADKNVGTGKTVSVSGISVTGTDVGNYTFNTTTSTTANITAKALTLTATGVNKVYDGTTDATVTLVDDRVPGDVLTTSYGSASFADKNVGTGKTVSVTGISIGGTDAGNYTSNTTASTTADITPKALTITANDRSKTYGETVTFAGTEFTADGLVNADTVTSVTLTSSGAGASAAVGTYPIVPSAAVGTGLSNYSISYVNGTLTVNPGAATRLEVTGSGTMTAGTTNELTITARDAYGNIDTSYSGPKNLVFSGPGNAPAGNIPTVEGINIGASISVPFTAGVSNASAATLIAYKAESTTVDVSDGSINSFGSEDYDLDLTVNPAAAARLEVTGSATMTAGATNELTITAKDSYGNVATAYSGAKSLTFSGPANAPGGQIPAVEGTNIGASTLVTFISGVSNAGAATLMAYKAESTTVDVSDGSINSSGSLDYDLDLTVDPAAAEELDLKPEGGSVIAGTPFSVTVTAYDNYSNTVTGYTSTVRFTSSDTATGVVLPADYTFTSGDSGVRAFTNGVTLLTSALHTVTVTDVVNGLLTDTEWFYVSPSESVHHIVISPDSAVIAAGTPQAYTAQAYDLGNNPIGDVTGGTIFSIDAGAGGTWAGGEYSSAKAGTWTVTGVYGAFTDDAILTVNAGAAHHVVISPDSATITAGATRNYTARAFDAWDNGIGDVTPETAYKIDPAAGGSWGGPYYNVYTSEKAGSWTVTGTYSGLPASPDTASLTISAGAIDHFEITCASYAQKVGDRFDITVTAYDEFDNIVTDSIAIVHVTSSEESVLSFRANPDGAFVENSTPIRLDKGRLTITVIGLKPVDSVTITATRLSASGTSPPFSITTDSTNVTNHSPVATGESYSVTQNSVLNVLAPAGVLANDTDADGDRLTPIVVGSVDHGTLTLSADGSFTYDPERGFTGTDAFTYMVNDGTANSNVTTVVITVSPETTTGGSGGMSPWVWGGGVLAAGLLGGAMYLYWRGVNKRRTRLGSVAALKSRVSRVDIRRVEQRPDEEEPYDSSRDKSGSGRRGWPDWLRRGR